MSKPIRIAIFDGYALFRRGVIDVLRGTNLLVVAEDETMDLAEELIGKCEPDIVLFDIQAPGADIEKIADLLRSFPDLRFVILTASDEKEHIEQVWNLGVHGCVVKGSALTSSFARSKPCKMDNPICRQHWPRRC